MIVQQHQSKVETVNVAELYERMSDGRVKVGERYRVVGRTIWDMVERKINSLYVITFFNGIVVDAVGRFRERCEDTPLEIIRFGRESASTMRCILSGSPEYDRLSKLLDGEEQKWHQKNKFYQNQKN